MWRLVCVHAGVDPLLSRHIAHLWVRDPLVIYNETVYVDDRAHTNHFEVCVVHVLRCCVLRACVLLVVLLAGTVLYADVVV